MGVTCREGTAYSGTPVFVPVSEHDVRFVFTSICFVGVYFYLCYLNLFTNTGVQHDFHISVFSILCKVLYIIVCLFSFSHCIVSLSIYRFFLPF